MAEKKKVAKKKAAPKSVRKTPVRPKPVFRPEPKHVDAMARETKILRTMPAGNFDEVSRLLEEARKAHLAAKVYARGEARPAGFKAHWQTAYEARKRADELDPAHLAPGWKAEEGFAGKDTHNQLMAFYGSVGCV